MSRGFRVFLVRSIAVLLAPSVLAQDSVRVDTSSEIELRVPDTSTIQNYAADPDFQYVVAPENPNSLRQRILNFLLGMLARILGSPIGGFVFRAILIIAVAALVIVLVNQLMGGELIYVFKKNKSDEGFSLGINQEELENTDYDQLFKQSILNNDYHSATRFAYLIALKLLTQKELILWGIEKTNLDYSRELTGHPLRKEFQSLTTFYEFVEYGDFEIDHYQFETFHATFKKFRGSLNG